MGAKRLGVLVGQSFRCAGMMMHVARRSRLMKGQIYVEMLLLALLALFFLFSFSFLFS